MTRRSDLMLEDLIGCDHEPTLPVTQNGEVLYWRCTCGAKKWEPPPETKLAQEEDVDEDL